MKKLKKFKCFYLIKGLIFLIIFRFVFILKCNKNFGKSSYNIYFYLRKANNYLP